MKSVIVFKSKTGFTKRYATWIQEETGFELLEYAHAAREILSPYGIIIYGGRVHAGQVDGWKKFKEKLDNKKKIIVFATGATPVEAKETIDTMWKTNLNEEELNIVPHYYFQAGLSYENMKLGDKLLMKMLAKMLSKKEDKTSVESGCQQSISSSYDVSSREDIIPLIDYIKTIE